MKRRCSRQLTNKEREKIIAKFNQDLEERRRKEEILEKIKVEEPKCSQQF